MKSLIKVLAIVGTGMIIGSVAGKYLKSERRQVGKVLKDLANYTKLTSRSDVNENQNELEMYFI